MPLALAREAPQATRQQSLVPRPASRQAPGVTPRAHLCSVALLLAGACSPSAETPAETEALPTPPAAVTRSEDIPEVPAPNQADPVALAQLVAKAPDEPASSTGPDGRSELGSDTGEPMGEVAPLPSTLPELESSKAKVQPALSSPAIERAAREQIYWHFRKCKAPDGRLPPPESITLFFIVRQDGVTDPASVSATVRDESLAPVAECIVREFSALPFEGPPGARRTTARVIVRWPSVD